MSGVRWAELGVAWRSVARGVLGARPQLGLSLELLQSWTSARRHATPASLPYPVREERGGDGRGVSQMAH